MRLQVLLSAASLSAILLSGCPGSVMENLPPGSGQGSYIGVFLADEDNAELGQFALSIDDVGTVSGSGTLSGRSITIEGIFAAAVVEAILTDTLSQESGDFDGELASGNLAGDFRLETNTGDDVFGFWDATAQ